MSSTSDEAKLFAFWGRLVALSQRGGANRPYDMMARDSEERRRRDLDRIRSATASVRAQRAARQQSASMQTRNIAPMPALWDSPFVQQPRHDNEPRSRRRIPEQLMEKVA